MDEGNGLTCVYISLCEEVTVLEERVAGGIVRFRDRVRGF